MKHSRGIRNHNPGNIERNRIAWRGLADDQSGDARFCVFKTPEYGIRAMARILRNYQRKHNLCCVRDIIGRWAPEVENDTSSYVDHVAHAVGCNPDQSLDLEDTQTLTRLIRVIIEHENGTQPYDDAVIERGIIIEGGNG